MGVSAGAQIARRLAGGFIRCIALWPASAYSRTRQLYQQSLGDSSGVFLFGGPIGVFALAARRRTAVLAAFLGGVLLRFAEQIRHGRIAGCATGL